jgi:hypothetical protein
MAKMKKINHEFGDEESSPGIQMIIDENFFNMFMRQMGVSETSYSLRQALEKAPPQAQMMKMAMTTSAAG